MNPVCGSSSAARIAVQRVAVPNASAMLPEPSSTNSTTAPCHAETDSEFGLVPTGILIVPGGAPKSKLEPPVPDVALLVTPVPAAATLPRSVPVLPELAPQPSSAPMATKHERNASTRFA